MIRFRGWGLAAALAVSSAALATQASAQPAPKQSEACFLKSDVDGFNAPDDHTVYIRAGVNDVYRLDLMSDCLNLSFRTSLGIDSTPGADPWVCSPLDATIVYNQNGIHERCPVTALHKLTKSELEALPKRDRP